MKLFFYAGSCIPIHAGSLNERPLGGTETGVIRVAAGLAARGHDVTVFTSHPSPPQSAAPRYLPHTLIQQGGQCDVLIVVQEWWGIFAPVARKRCWFWTGDGGEQYANYGIGDCRSIERIDRLLTVSRWQAQHLSDESNFPVAKTFVVGNGVHLAWFDGEEPRNRMRLIYSSAPYRGLVLAPAIYQELRRGLPALEFHVFAGLAVYDRAGPFAGPEAQQYEQIKRVLQGLPGCVIHGNIMQQQLAREYMRSAIFFYPNTFRETSCITALEAQAAGCPVVTSARGALPETVGEAGFVVEGEPGSEEYNRSFVDAVRRLLTDDELWQRCSQAGKRRIRDECSWDHVVDRFEAALHVE